MPQNNDQLSSTYRPHTTSADFIDYFVVLVTYKRLIVGLTLAATILSIIVVLLLPGSYTARAMILSNEDDKGIGAMLSQLGGLASAAGLGGPTKADLYMTMLRSETVKDQLIDRFKLLEVYKVKMRVDVYRILDKKVSVSAGKKDGVLTIAVDDTDPKRAAEMANAYVEELGSLAVRLNTTSAGNNRVYLEERLVTSRADLARAEELLKAFQAKNKAVSVTDQAKATIEGVAQLRAQLAAQEVQLAILQRQFAEESQKVKTARATVDNLRTQIGKLEGMGGGSSSIPSVGSMPQLGQEYMRLMRDFKVHEALVELLTKQYEVAKLSEVKGLLPFQVLQVAKAPERRSKPERRKVVTTVFLLALVGFSILALAYDNFQKIQMNRNSSGS